MAYSIKPSAFALAWLLFFSTQSFATELLRVKSSLVTLRTELLNGTIAGIHIYFMPYSTETLTRVTPEQLERQADHKDKFNVSSKLKDTLVASIDGTKLYETKYEPSLRWGAVFVDKVERQVHSIYLEGRYITGTGRIGIIDGTEVGLNGALITWFEMNFLNH